MTFIVPSLTILLQYSSGALGSSSDFRISGELKMSEALRRCTWEGLFRWRCPDHRRHRRLLWIFAIEVRFLEEYRTALVQLAIIPCHIEIHMDYVFTWWLARYTWRYSILCFTCANIVHMYSRCVVIAVDITRLIQYTGLGEVTEKQGRSLDTESRRRFSVHLTDRTRACTRIVPQKVETRRIRTQFMRRLNVVEA